MNITGMSLLVCRIFHMTMYLYSSVFSIRCMFLFFFSFSMNYLYPSWRNSCCLFHIPRVFLFRIFFSPGKTKQFNEGKKSSKLVSSAVPITHSLITLPIVDHSSLFTHSLWTHHLLVQHLHSRTFRSAHSIGSVVCYRSALLSLHLFIFQ